MMQGSTIEARAPSFRWTCGFMGRTTWIVSDHSGTFEVEHRHTTCGYERSIHNGDDGDFQRTVVAMLGTILRHDGRPLDQRTVDAFNAHKASEHARQIAQLRADPERYGPILDSDHPAPALVRGFYYLDGYQPAIGAPASNGADIRVQFESNKAGAVEQQHLRDLIAGARSDWSALKTSWQITAY